MEEKRPKTSILYRVSNVAFEQVCVFGYIDVISAFRKGPQAACDFLKNLWERERTVMSKRVGEVDFIDIDKEIKAEDFRITFKPVTNIADVFFIHFPLVDNTSGDYDAACRCLAFVLMEDCPRFLTMEYGHHFTESGMIPCFMFGEWKFNYKKGVFSHSNFGKMERDTIEHFATIVEAKLLNSDNK